MRQRGLSPGILHSREAIGRRVRELAARISEDFAGRELMMIGVLNGSFVFLADLAREVPLPVRCGFVQIRESRGAGPMREIAFTLSGSVEGRCVLLVEDILDTGVTLSYLTQQLRQRSPERLATCVLLDKPQRRRVDFTPDYVGFTAPDRWIVGYGLDHDGLYRNLPYLTSIEEPT